MTREEYVEKMKKDDDWAPGWDAIDREFDRLYPGQEPAHYGTNIHARAIFGGDNYLDGYSVYESQKGYQHIVTYGMSELYANEEAFGGEYSRWGYEMTIKLKENSAEDCLWALDPPRSALLPLHPGTQRLALRLPLWTGACWPPEPPAGWAV